MQPPLPPTPQAPRLALPGASANDAYNVVVAFRRELNRQLEELESRRGDMKDAWNQEPSGPQRSALTQRIAEIDQRIADLDRQIATADAQVASAAAVPGAVIPDDRGSQSSSDDGIWIVIPVMFMLCVFLPLSIAYARRLWRKADTVVAAFPRELAERLTRMEQGMESTAVEVERIGEGQRFLTKLFTEGPGARLMGQGASESARLPGSGGQNRD